MHRLVLHWSPVYPIIEKKTPHVLSLPINYAKYYKCPLSTTKLRKLPPTYATVTQLPSKFLNRDIDVEPFSG